jgi:hypothetical protein
VPIPSVPLQPSLSQLCRLLLKLRLPCRVDNTFAILRDPKHDHPAAFAVSKRPDDGDAFGCECDDLWMLTAIGT